MATIKTDDYLTPMEAATLMGCSLATVYNYIKNGKLKKLKILGSSVIKKSDAEEIRLG